MNQSDKPPSGEVLQWIGRETIAQQQVAQNAVLPLEERLEAYEDIIDSEIGDTTLVRARHIEREFGLRQLYLKFEGSNPTGTQKDRIAFAQCMDALRRGYDTITVATCGNYGMAMALAAGAAGLRCMIYIPETYHTSRIREMENMNAQIFRLGVDYEEAVDISAGNAEQYGWYDANPGGNNTILQLQAYGEIAFEIYDDLRDAPSVVAVPASNGTVLAGIYKGFTRLYKRGKISRVPAMVAGSSYKKNPIIHAIQTGKEVCEKLKPHQIKETRINEPLINWYALDGDWALDAIISSKGWAHDVSDKKMQNFARLLKEKESVNVLPAATAGLAALIEQHLLKPLPNDRYVAVLTARKV